MTEAAIIRSAAPSDSVSLSDLAYRSKAFWGYPADFMEACRAELSVSVADIENAELVYFVAELCGEIIGYYALRRMSAIEFDLEALFVEPQHIGRGIGRHLMEHAKNHARRIGASSLLIQGDPHAESFYRAAGGKLVGERESDSIKGRYLPEFRIDLSGSA